MIIYLYDQLQIEAAASNTSDMKIAIKTIEQTIWIARATKIKFRFFVEYLELFLLENIKTPMINNKKTAIQMV